MNELQGIVLCGGSGSRMTELTDHTPKCMLPVAGRPMFWFPLNFLHKNSIKNVIMIVPGDLRAEISNLLNGPSFAQFNMHIEVEALNNPTESAGTADALRQIESKIKYDFIVVSGDFISDISLAPMLALHRAECAAVTCLLTSRAVDGPTPGPKVKRRKERDFVGLSNRMQLLFLGLEEDFDDDIPINLSTLAQCKNVVFTTQYNDCHVYIMKKYILNVIEAHKSFSSIKADVIPYLIEQQYDGTDKELKKHTKIEEFFETSAMMIEELSFGECAKRSACDCLCFAYVLPPENGNIIAHANTTGSYFEVNKAIVPYLESRFGIKNPDYSKSDQQNSPLMQDSYVSPSAKIFFSAEGRQEKPQIRRSVVDDGAVIGSDVKITSSLIMRNSIIGNGAEISNSIICEGAEIGEGASVLWSIVANNQKVAAFEEKENELLAPEDEFALDDWIEEQ